VAGRSGHRIRQRSIGSGFESRQVKHNKAVLLCWYIPVKTLCNV
jgi:hypothetical protein